MEKILPTDKNVITARIKSYGKTYEILVNADKALEFKRSGKGNITDIVESPGVFLEIKKGLKVSDKELEESFGTSDFYKISEKIILEGELQLPKVYKDQHREAKLNQIVEFLATSCSDPKGIPHPPDRIRTAIDQAGVKIDENKPVEQQALVILRLIQKLLPIRLVVKRVAVKIPVEFTGKLYGYVKEYAIQEEWLADGSLSCVVEIPLRTQSEFYDRLNSVTHGSAITKEMN